MTRLHADGESSGNGLMNPFSANCVLTSIRSTLLDPVGASTGSGYVARCGSEGNAGCGVELRFDHRERMLGLEGIP